MAYTVIEGLFMNQAQILTKTFCEFVQISSPTSMERKFSNFLRKSLEHFGYECLQDRRANLLVKVPGSGQPLLFTAHMDTVEPGRFIVPVVEKGIVKSQGQTILGADNKAMVAVLFELLRNLRGRNGRHRPLEVLFTVSEEAGIPGSETFNTNRLMATEGFCFDAAQPVGTIILDSPYYMRQDVKIIGKQADASNPKNGKSVIPTLAYYLNTAPKGYQGKDTFYNIGSIRGGHGANAILDSVELHAEIRSFDLKKIYHYAKIVENLAKTAENLDKCQVFYSEFLENHGYKFSISSPLVKAAATAIEKLFGSDNLVYRRHYWGISDANNLNKRNLQVLNLGYGAKNPHTVQETIAVKDLLLVLRLIEQMIK